MIRGRSLAPPPDRSRVPRLQKFTAELEDEVEEVDDSPRDGQSGALEIYKQHSQNARNFMNLRFRHFATFAVIVGFVATGAFNVPGLLVFREVILAVGIWLTILFWNLDARTGQYLSYHARVATEAEARIATHAIPPAPRARIFGASATTDLIFATILAAWLSLLLWPHFPQIFSYLH